MGRRHVARLRGTLLSTALRLAGSFRLPVPLGEDARKAMERVIAASRAEPGCREYAYAQDLLDPGLWRVSEAWESQAALDAHFASDHMRRWQAEREGLGFADRRMWRYAVAAEQPL